MSASHLKRIREELSAQHWTILSESSELNDDEDFYWRISSPNGDCPLTIEFTAETDGKHGGGRPIDDIELAYACSVSAPPSSVNLYFGSKFSGKFQIDVVEFVTKLASIEDSLSDPRDDT